MAAYDRFYCTLLPKFYPDQMASKVFPNKTALGLWVANLKMTIYKGIGKQSPAINFDRSAVSLRLYMGYVHKTNRM